LTKEVDILLIGGGIMSATLGVMLRKLMPNAKITICERLERVAAESSDCWNNAGTGHSAFCELNYTPIRQDGSVDLTKALRIAEQFEVSKQLWTYLKENNHLPQSEAFINDIPHMSFVWGADNVDFLKKRYDAMVRHPIFDGLLYTTDHTQIEDWVPLMMKGRVHEHPIAATHMDIGTDVNFGAITHSMIKSLERSENIELYLGHEVKNLTKQKDGKWYVDIEDRNTNQDKDLICDYVFIGAGGGSLTLLEHSDIEEGRGYGGFPVSGHFLACDNEDVVLQHEAKVYGKAAVGSPPMSVPHLDTRWINGKRSLLFGPYAGFSTKFLKKGSYLDLFLSIEMHNVWPMLSAGIDNIPLTKYLVDQVMQSPEDRFESLRAYYPEARFEDWDLKIAGQRVQIIKKDKDGNGKLQFGTEIVCAADGRLSALLGASPGASTSVSIMLEVLNKMFPEQMKSVQWISSIKEMIPSYGQSLISDKELCHKTRDRTSAVLKLDD